MEISEDYTKFDFYIEGGIENLRNEGWSDKKIALCLRNMAQELSPRKIKSKKITINPLKISDEEISKLPQDIKNKIKKIKEQFASEDLSEGKE